MITPRKWQQLYDLMLSLQIEESDLIERFIIGSGSGGQKLHKSASCVHLKHVPSRLVIKCQETRSREDNRYLARKRLCEKIDEQQNAAQSKVQRKIQKIRQQKKRRSRRSKEKILQAKHQQGAQKSLRKKPKADE